MVITAHVSVYNIFGVLGSDHGLRNIVDQCFRVKLSSKKRACIILSPLLSMLSKSTAERV